MCRFWRGTVAAGRGSGHLHILHVVPYTFISKLFFNIIVNTMDPYSYRSVGSMEDLTRARVAVSATFAMVGGGGPK